MKTRQKRNVTQWSVFVFIVVLSFMVGVVSRHQPPVAQAASPAEQLVYLPIITGSEEVSATGDVYYISPTGNDSRSGRTPAQAWATFDRAWQDLYPGDTLILLDGIYYQRLNPNKRNGEPGLPITIRAMNDGQAIIDGQYQRTPIKLGNTWPGPIGNHFVIEGIVARNSNDYVIVIDGGSNNTLRRVSAYNANTNTNAHVIGIIWPSAQNNLIEDCVAAGSGRKMIMIYGGENNTVRRCFANWQVWDGRDFCGVTWPGGDNIQVYNGNYNIIENSIAYGSAPGWAISVQANDPNAAAIGNQVLGSVAIGAGMNPDGTVKQWGNTRPQPTSCTGMTQFDWPSQRVGFQMYGQGILRDNLFQDIFSWGNAGLGLSFTSGAGFHAETRNNQLRNATLVNNGLDNPHGPWPGKYGGRYTDVLATELARFSNVAANDIPMLFVSWPNYPNGQRVLAPQNGPGARLTHRYINGVLTEEPLWPWPMEARIQAELGISVTGLVNNALVNAVGQGVGAQHVGAGR